MYNCYGRCENVHRGFLTREEKIEVLKKYKEALDKESKGVAEKINELEKEE